MCDATEKTSVAKADARRRPKQRVADNMRER